MQTPSAIAMTGLLRDRDAVIERVLLTEEGVHLVDPTRRDHLVQRPHVATGAETALPRPVEEHHVDVGVALPAIERHVEGADHLEVEGVDGPRAIQRQMTEAATASDQDAVCGGVAGADVFGSRCVHGATLHRRFAAPSAVDDCVFAPGSGKMGRTHAERKVPYARRTGAGARRLTKRFGSISAVDDLSARIEPGQVTGFLGPNGAGKTTSLRMLLGLVRPTSGTATIGGTHFSELTSPLQTVGAALEASSFHPGRSAANHLKVYARAAGLQTSRVDEVLGLVGLADVAGRRVGGFSLGMRQRLGLATALLGDPGVVVLDEPSNGLDPRHPVDALVSCGTSPKRVARSSSRRTSSPRCSRRSTRC